MNSISSIENLTDDMLSHLARLVKHNSVQGPALADKPFGEGPAAALGEALCIADEMGFSTVNMENYCGYAEMGEGQDIIGIVAHLDVVPAGDGWDTDPFTLTRKEGRVYGRGVSDDKGAIIAALYAMKLLWDSGQPIRKRIRLLMGCNEESGSECMKYYVQHGEPVTTGFTPDGYFPGIHGEKGLCSMTAYSKNTHILSMNGGFVTNAVCSHCVTEVPLTCVDPVKLEAAFAKTPLVSSSVTVLKDRLHIEAQGTAAHASTPDLGVNAAAYTMWALKEAGMQDDFVDFYLSHLGTDCDGAGIGCKFADDYGALTFNNGIVETKDGTIRCTIDIRFPVTLTAEKLKAMATPHLEDAQGRIEIQHIVEPLFYPEDSPLVQDLYRAYVEVTGDTSHKPMVIGGGTYAKSIPGIIAFGCEFPDTDNHIHDVNESLDIHEFQMQTAIYLKALQNMLAE